MPLLRNIVRRILPKRFKPHRIFGGPLRGKYLVTSWHDYPAAIVGYAERALTTWLLANAKKGETWLDIGAHYGYTSLALCEAVGPTGRVYAFEPSLSTIGCLSLTKKGNGLSQLRLIPLALTADEFPRSYEMRTIRGMIDSQISGVESQQIENFLGLSLDRLWPEISPLTPTVHGIKIDVQGMELDVLEGMRGILASQTPLLVVEVHKLIDRGAILALLQQAGYDPTPFAIEKLHTNFYDESINYSFVFTRMKCGS